MSSLAESPEYQAFLRFIDLTLERRQLKSRLDEVDAILEALEPPLLSYLAASGLQSLTVRNTLLYPQRTPWVYPAQGVSRQMVCEALKVAGLGRMVREDYSTQSLTAYVKELEDHSRLIAGLDDGAMEKLLPPALAPIVNVKASYHIRIKRKEPKDPYVHLTDPAREPDEQQA